jgi:hypothetical protein
MHYPIIVVDWGDAFIDTDDFDVKDAKNTRPVMRRTVGFLIAKNKYGYVLATDEFAKKKDGVSAKMFVPLGMVKRVTQMTPTPEE